MVKKKSRNTPVECPECGRFVFPRKIKNRFNKSKVHGGGQGVRHTFVYECCGQKSYGIGSPLVSRQTLAARRQAHESFDRIWKEGHAPRGMAYRLLAQQMGRRGQEIHMKTMNLQEAVFTVFAADDLYQKFKRLSKSSGRSK